MIYKRNQMTTASFWAETAMLALVMGIVYYCWGFRNCLFLSRTASLVFFIILDITSLIIIGIISCRKQKNSFSIWAMVLTPIELYTILAYFSAQGGKIVILIAVWILSVIIYLLIRSSRALKAGKEFRLSPRFVPILIRNAWILGTLVYLILLIPILSRGAKGIEVSLDYTIVDNSTKGLTITSQQENLTKFDSSIWKKLEPSEREELIQLVANIEANELGLSYELFVGFRDFSDQAVNSAYLAADHKILIDENVYLAEDGEEIIRLVCHQAYHAYERSIVDLYIDSNRKFQKLMTFSNVENYIAELQKNVQALDDRINAERERLEADAVKYAEEKTQEYFYWINFAMNSKK